VFFFVCVCVWGGVFVFSFEGVFACGWFLCCGGGGRPITKPARVCVQKAVLRDHMYDMTHLYE